jgi:hypothetical protein
LADCAGAEWDCFETAGSDIASQNHGPPFHAKAQGMAKFDSFHDRLAAAADAG